LHKLKEVGNLQRAERDLDVMGGQELLWAHADAADKGIALVKNNGTRLPIRSEAQKQIHACYFRVLCTSEGRDIPVATEQVYNLKLHREGERAIRSGKQDCARRLRLAELGLSGSG